jgi:uncharacterized iron-regulated protein
MPAKRILLMGSTSKAIQLFLLGCVLLFSAACVGGAPGTPHSDAAINPVEWSEGQIIDTATGEPVSVDQLMDRLLQQEVVYLGEEHHNRFHIEAALSLLQRLASESRSPILAMEMFGWDGQPIVDRYLAGSDLSREEFLGQVRWQQTWGGPFEDYEPLVQYARAQHLPLTAMNPPKVLVRLVARSGLAQARREPEMARWGMQDETIVDDPAYRERILRQLRACHDGGPDALYQMMYEASMVRDEGMARTVVSLVEALRSGNDPLAGPVVSYTGGGHIQYNLPVPKRVARRLLNQVRQVSIYMTSYEKGRFDDLREMIGGKIADYVWLTSVSAQGPPRRCR